MFILFARISARCCSMYVLWFDGQYCSARSENILSINSDSVNKTNRFKFVYVIKLATVNYTPKTRTALWTKIALCCPMVTHISLFLNALVRTDVTMINNFKETFHVSSYWFHSINVLQNCLLQNSSRIYKIIIEFAWNENSAKKCHFSFLSKKFINFSIVRRHLSIISTPQSLQIFKLVLLLCHFPAYIFLKKKYWSISISLFHRTVNDSMLHMIIPFRPSISLKKTESLLFVFAMIL